MVEAAASEGQAGPRVIETEEDVGRGLRALARLDPRLAPVIASTAVPLRRRAPGFAGLAEIVTAQQVSKASAAAIFARLERLVAPLDASRFAQASDGTLREAGLSAAKVRTLRGLAEAVAGGLDLEALALAPPAQAQATLTALHGIGPWTAEAFLLFCAGHEDVFPAGDLALQVAVGDVAGLGERPTERATRAVARAWSPHRSVAARLMWAHYARLTRRDAAAV